MIRWSKRGSLARIPFCLFCPVVRVLHHPILAHVNVETCEIANDKRRRNRIRPRHSPRTLSRLASEPSDR